VPEQAGGKQRLDAGVDLECIETAARARLEVGADGVRLDPLVALNADGTDGDGLGARARCRERHHARPQQKRSDDEAYDAQSPENQPTNVHSPLRPSSSPWVPRFRTTHEKGRRHTPAALTAVSPQCNRIFPHTLFSASKFPLHLYRSGLVARSPTSSP